MRMNHYQLKVQTWKKKNGFSFSNRWGLFIATLVVSHAAKVRNCLGKRFSGTTVIETQGIKRFRGTGFNCPFILRGINDTIPQITRWLVDSPVFQRVKASLPTPFGSFPMTRGMVPLMLSAVRRTICSINILSIFWQRCSQCAYPKKMGIGYGESQRIC